MEEGHWLSSWKPFLYSVISLIHWFVQHLWIETFKKDQKQLATKICSSEKGIIRWFFFFIHPLVSSTTCLWWMRWPACPLPFARHNLSLTHMRTSLRQCVLAKAPAWSRGTGLGVKGGCWKGANRPGWGRQLGSNEGEDCVWDHPWAWQFRNKKKLFKILVIIIALLFNLEKMEIFKENLSLWIFSVGKCGWSSAGGGGGASDTPI